MQERGRSSSSYFTAEDKVLEARGMRVDTRRRGKRRSGFNFAADGLLWTGVLSEGKCDGLNGLDNLECGELVIIH